MLHRRRHSRGFVLLWTLALLALAAVVLSGLSRHSALRAVEAVDAQERLQRKWAVACCRKMLLSNAEALLAGAEKRRGLSVGALWVGGNLGDVQVQVRIADEQAKVNLNAVYGQIGKQRTASLVRELRHVGSGVPAILLRPDPRASVNAENVVAHGGATTRPGTGTSNSNSAWRPFGSWSQVFERDNPAELMGNLADSVAADMTCWGDGRLNLDRASPAAIRALLGTQFSATQIDALVRARAKDPHGTIEQWAGAARLTTDQQTDLSQLLTDQSSCHSVMIHVRCGARNEYELAVLEAGGGPARKRPATMSTQSAPGASKDSPDGSQALDDSGPAHVYRLVW